MLAALSVSSFNSLENAYIFNSSTWYGKNKNKQVEHYDSSTLKLQELIIHQIA
jgi:hypothetical protein